MHNAANVMENFGYRSLQQRLQQLELRRRANDLAIAYRQHISQRPGPKARKHVAKPPVTTSKVALVAASDETRAYIWWINDEQTKAAVTMCPSQSLTTALVKFKKVPGGGWLFNGMNCVHRDGPKKCNGIAISHNEKIMLEEMKAPGIFSPFKQ